MRPYKNQCLFLSRWIYYSEGYALHRVTLNGIEKQVVVNLTARPIGIDMGMFSYRYLKIRQIKVWPYCISYLIIFNIKTRQQNNKFNYTNYTVNMT